MLSIASQERYDNFQAAEMAKGNIYPELNQNLVEKYRRKFTAEEQAEIRQQIALRNLELTVYDFIIFNTLQDLFFKVKPMMETAGIFKHQFKNIHNRAKNEIDQMNIACRSSENRDFMASVTGYFDTYRKDYMEDGGIFFDSVNYKFHEMVKDDMVKLHYSIRMALINSKSMNEKYTDIAVQLYKIRCFCEMMEQIREYIHKSINDMVGCNVPVKDVQFFRFNSFYNNIKQLSDMLAPTYTSLPKASQNMITLAADIIVQRLLGSKMADNIMDALSTSIKDYAYYAVARMIIDVRNGRHIIDEARKELAETLNFTPIMFDKMEKEMRRTRIDISSGDPYEIKDLVPMMKGDVTKGVFLQKVCYDLENDCNNKKKSWKQLK